MMTDEQLLSPETGENELSLEKTSAHGYFPNILVKRK